MLIADAQTHIWSANTPERPWPVKEPPHIPHKGLPAFSKDELLREMDAAGVQRAVITPPRWEGGQNDVALQAAQLHPDRFAVMGSLDINTPDSRGRIAAWRQQPGMLGLRFTSKFEESSKWDRVWSEAEEANVPIMMMSHAQLDLIDRVAQSHVGLKLTIDHLGIPQGGFRNGKRDDAAFAHLEGLLTLAKRPNVAVKASALPCYTSDSYPYPRLHPHIRRVFDAFGPKRMFWGTDLTKLPCSYRQAVTLFTEEISWLTAEDKEWIMGRGLCEWLGWKLPD